MIESPPLNMRFFCENAVDMLENCTHTEFTPVFLKLKKMFWEIYQKPHNLTISNLHGIYFFENILFCLKGGEWIEEGEYGDNFRYLIALAKMLDKIEEE